LRRLAIKSGLEKKDLRLLYAMIIAPPAAKLLIALGTAKLLLSESEFDSMSSTSSKMLSLASILQYWRKEGCRDFSF
jgi:hypothetical protein